MNGICNNLSLEMSKVSTKKGVGKSFRNLSLHVYLIAIEGVISYFKT